MNTNMETGSSLDNSCQGVAEATTHKDLLARLNDLSLPKSEIEWAAVHEIERLNNLLTQWQESAHTKTKHILETELTLNENQFQRLREQMTEQFGMGNVILLEGGVKYIGITG